MDLHGTEYVREGGGDDVRVRGGRIVGRGEGRVPHPLPGIPVSLQTLRFDRERLRGSEYLTVRPKNRPAPGVIQHGVFRGEVGVGGGTWRAKKDLGPWLNFPKARNEHPRM